LKQTFKYGIINNKEVDMKKLLVIFSVLLSLNLFALNDGKYEVVQKNSDYTLNFKLIVKNSKILFVDFDKTDINGQRLSTVNQNFRNKKENMKKYIIENQTLENLPVEYKKELGSLIDFLLEKSNSSEPGTYQLN
jgi:hypothetical protein